MEIERDLFSTDPFGQVHNHQLVCVSLVPAIQIRITAVEDCSFAVFLTNIAAILTETFFWLVQAALTAFVKKFTPNVRSTIRLSSSDLVHTKNRRESFFDFAIPLKCERSS